MEIIIKLNFANINKSNQWLWIHDTVFNLIKELYNVKYLKKWSKVKTRFKLLS